MHSSEGHAADRGWHDEALLVLSGRGGRRRWRRRQGWCREVAAPLLRARRVTPPFFPVPSGGTMSLPRTATGGRL